MNKETAQTKDYAYIDKSGRKRRLTLKQEGFIRDVIKTKNLTKSALNNYEIAKSPRDMTARVIGSENLAKPYIKEEINKRLAENGLDIDTIINTHKRNLLQNKNLSVSQTAVKDAYDLYGLTGNKEQKTQTNIAIIME